MIVARSFLAAPTLFLAALVEAAKFLRMPMGLKDAASVFAAKNQKSASADRFAIINRLQQQKIDHDEQLFCYPRQPNWPLDLDASSNALVKEILRCCWLVILNEIPHTNQLFLTIPTTHPGSGVHIPLNCILQHLFDTIWGRIISLNGHGFGIAFTAEFK